MEITFAARTDVGQVRENNEDNFLVDRKLRLYVVCDGMGGHAAGAVASATAVNVVREIISEARVLLDEYDGSPASGLRKDVLALVERAILQACLRIHDRAQRNPSERGMGTTLSLLLVCGQRAFLGHVGDSRVYLLREGAIHQLTDDHSLLADMVKHGRIRSANEVDPRFRNAVTRAVGVHATVEVDTLDLAILPGDRFLMCSDGLTGYAGADALERMLNDSDDEQELCDRMIDHANAMGGVDNITSVVVTVREAPQCDPEKVRLILKVLRGLTLFRYLSYSELLRVMNIAEERRVEKGEYCFSRGETGENAYVILDGQVQVMTSNVVIAVLDPGRHFGEMGLVDDQPRMADAVALEDSWMLVIPRSSFYDMMRKNPQLAVKLLWSFIKAITVRLRLTTNELTLTKQLFHAVSPEEFGRLPQEWLPPDDLGRVPPEEDSGPIDLRDVQRSYDPDTENEMDAPIEDEEVPTVPESEQGRDPSDTMPDSWEGMGEAPEMEEEGLG